MRSITAITDPPAIVARANDIEAEDVLIEKARNAGTHSHWEIGRAAYLWSTAYARGRSYADFARAAELAPALVQRCAFVYRHFGDRYRQAAYRNLSWSHFNTVCPPDALGTADQYLRRAASEKWTCDQLKDEYFAAGLMRGSPPAEPKPKPSKPRFKPTAADIRESQIDEDSDPPESELDDDELAEPGHGDSGDPLDQWHKLAERMESLLVQQQQRKWPDLLPKYCLQKLHDWQRIIEAAA